MSELIIQIHPEDVKTVKWPKNNNHEEFDANLHKLGANKYDKFLVVNPVIDKLYNEETNPIYYIDEDLPNTNRCICWTYNNNWVAKLFTKDWTPEDEYLVINIEEPTGEWEQNKDLGDTIHFKQNPINLFKMSSWDSSYLLVWYLDPAFNKSKDKVWVIRHRPTNTRIRGVKDMGYITPTLTDMLWTRNTAFSESIKFDNDPMINFNPELWDTDYELVWYLTGDIWAIKCQMPNKEYKGTKHMGYITPLLLDHLDVVFISYNEPNAETNWQRVLEKAPWARRVDGVDGIFNAHRAAAQLVDTDMFYVVDGDAWLADDFDFNFQPSLFNRNSTHIWHSKNPINGLEYGYGGVKLFPKHVITSITSWETLDMTTSISSDIIVVEKSSNVTNFNTDAFSTWRSAFRECVKLCYNIKNNPDDKQSLVRLESWKTLYSEPYSEYACLGANAAVEFFNKNNESLTKINDRNWLMLMFNMNKKSKDTLCAMPWTHMAFEPNGKVIPCCLTSSHNYYVGDLKTETVDKMWNSDKMKQLRKEMINGIEPKICDKCFNREKVTGESGRIYHNKDFPDVIKKIPEITLEDGTCTEMELKYWDFRFSNLCNFKCRSCGPAYSSAWVPDARKLGMPDQEKVWNIESVGDKTNFDFLKDHINVVERIYFAGGEPLMMPEHWQILDMLVENKRFDVHLSYNTNCSILSYGKKNIIDYWKQWEFGKVEIWPSIDEIGERAELIRSGTVWSKVEANLIELSKHDNIILRPGMTIGAWNVNRLPEIIEHLVSIGIIKHRNHWLNYNNFFINLLEHPARYHVSILPDEYRKETINKLTHFVSEYNKKYSTSLDEIFRHILHELSKPWDVESAKKFLQATKLIDDLRVEDTFAVIPEMECVRNAING